MAEIIQLFLIGLTSSFSACLVFCSPLIVGYIGTTRKGWSSGLKAVSLILASRLAGFIILGLLASIAGRLLLDWLIGAQNILFALGGLPMCQVLNRIKQEEVSFCVFPSS